MARPWPGHIPAMARPWPVYGPAIAHCATRPWLGIPPLKFVYVLSAQTIIIFVFKLDLVGGPFEICLQPLKGPSVYCISAQTFLAMARPWLGHGSAVARPCTGHGPTVAQPWPSHGPTITDCATEIRSKPTLPRKEPLPPSLTSSRPENFPGTLRFHIVVARFTDLSTTPETTWM